MTFLSGVVVGISITALAFLTFIAGWAYGWWL